jgi:hypothetical protein
VFVEDIEGKAMGHNDKVDYFTMYGTVTNFRADMEKPPYYNACPSTGCNKKVQGEPGAYHCEKCDKQFENCSVRSAHARVLTCDAISFFVVQIACEMRTTNLNFISDYHSPISQQPRFILVAHHKTHFISDYHSTTRNSRASYSRVASPIRRARSGARRSMTAARRCSAAPPPSSWRR